MFACRPGFDSRVGQADGTRHYGHWQDRGGWWSFFEAVRGADILGILPQPSSFKLVRLLQRILRSLHQLAAKEGKGPLAGKSASSTPTILAGADKVFER